MENGKNGTYVSFTQKLFVWILRQNEMPVLCSSMIQSETEILSFSEGAICK
jgi:hypothetical protein